MKVISPLSMNLFDKDKLRRAYNKCRKVRKSVLSDHIRRAIEGINILSWTNIKKYIELRI